MSFYIFDKPKNITSHDLVWKVKKKLNVSKAGHSGTLDPFATGLLIIATNEDTKFLELFLNSKKTYEGEFFFGKSTTTNDIDGIVIEESDDINNLKIDINSLQKIINEKFLGTIKQVPPAFSAIKIDGIKSYEKARKGEEVKLAPVFRKIFSFEINETEHNNILKFKIEVSSGTYIRAIIRDLSKIINIPAYLHSLKRTSIGFIDFKNNINKIDDENYISIPSEEIVLIKRILVDEGTMKTLLEGKKINFNAKESDLIFFTNSNKIVWAKNQHNFFLINKRIK